MVRPALCLQLYRGDPDGDGTFRISVQADGAERCLPGVRDFARRAVWRRRGCRRLQYRRRAGEFLHISSSSEVVVDSGAGHCARSRRTARRDPGDGGRRRGADAKASSVGSPGLQLSALALCGFVTFTLVLALISGRRLRQDLQWLIGSNCHVGSGLVSPNCD